MRTNLKANKGTVKERAKAQDEVRDVTAATVQLYASNYKWETGQWFAPDGTAITEKGLRYPEATLQAHQKVFEK